MARQASHPADGLAHVTDWVFDLDNTLYPADCDLFAQIDRRMTDFVSRTLSLSPADARALQKRYYAEHGTTLSGLMKVHGVPPADFLDYVHDIDLSPVDASPPLAAAIAALPGRKFVYTNGALRHAERVTEKLGLNGLIDGLYGIECADYTPKPHALAYDRFVTRFGIDPKRSAFFEDLDRNLKPASDLGFSTVLVTSEKDWSHEPVEARPARGGGDPRPHVHYETGDLAGFLQGLVKAPAK